MQQAGEDAKNRSLHVERPCYDTTQRRIPQIAWNSSVDVPKRLFDGKQARPYSAQCGPSPKASAKSGARSIDAWQRDYNPKGLFAEKQTTRRFERVTELKRQAQSEAARRHIPVEAVEEEMYVALRAASTRTDTGLRKDEMQAPSRTYPPAGGGPPRLFDGREKLEEGFSFKDAKDMFRGEAWEAMTAALMDVNPFKPPPEIFDETLTSPSRRSFHATPWLEHNSHEGEKSPGAAGLISLKKFLVLMFGTITAAWRLGLDHDGHGRLTIAEWSKALRALGFEGDCKAIYKELDTQRCGVVTFAEFEPDLASRMNDFSEKLKIKYGTAQMDCGGMVKNAYDWSLVFNQIDPSGDGKIEYREFVEVCGLIGYKNSAMEMFSQLRRNPDRKYVSVEDLKAMPKGC